MLTITCGGRMIPPFTDTRRAHKGTVALLRPHSKMTGLWSESMVHCLSSLPRYLTPVFTLILLAWLHLPVQVIAQLKGCTVAIKLWLFSLTSLLYDCLTAPAFSINSWLFIAIHLAFHHPEELRAICRLEKFMLFCFQEGKKKACYIRWNPVRIFL